MACGSNTLRGISIGGKLRHCSVYKGQCILYAYEIEKIRVTIRGKAVNGEYIVGSMLGETEPAAGEYVIEQGGTDFDEGDMDELSLSTRSGTDDHTGEECKINVPWDEH